MKKPLSMLTNVELMRVLGLDDLKNVTAVTIEMRPNMVPEVLVTFLPRSDGAEVVQRFELVPRQAPGLDLEAMCDAALLRLRAALDRDVDGHLRALGLGPYRLDGFESSVREAIRLARALADRG